MLDSLVIAGKTFGSRLIVGTGKYKSFQETARALEASGAEMVSYMEANTEVRWDGVPMPDYFPDAERLRCVLNRPAQFNDGSRERL